MHDVDDYPPFGLTSKLAELEQTWRNSLWGAEDTAWLNENAPLFDTGIYAFDANRWFSLAAQLFKANMRQDVWVLCCCDMDFAWPSPLNIPVKIKRPGDVLALASSWCYNHADQRVRPFWDSASQSLQALPRTGSFKKEHALTLLEAFSSHELLEQIKKSVLVQQAFGLDNASDILKDENDTQRWLGKVLHPNFLSPSGPENLPLPDLDL